MPHWQLPNIDHQPALDLRGPLSAKPSASEDQTSTAISKVDSDILINSSVLLESYIGVRHLQTFLMFMAMVLGLCMRVNMSLAIVDMTDLSKENVRLRSFNCLVTIDSTEMTIKN